MLYQTIIKYTQHYVIYTNYTWQRFVDNEILLKDTFEILQIVSEMMKMKFAITYLITKLYSIQVYILSDMKPCTNCELCKHKPGRKPTVDGQQRTRCPIHLSRLYPIKIATPIEVAITIIANVIIQQPFLHLHTLDTVQVSF